MSYKYCRLKWRRFRVTVGNCILIFLFGIKRRICCYFRMEYMYCRTVWYNIVSCHLVWNMVKILSHCLEHCLMCTNLVALFRNKPLATNKRNPFSKSFTIFNGNEGYVSCLFQRFSLCFHIKNL